MTKTCFIVAGPNGAGKTTFAETYLPKEVGCFNFVNADHIAKGLSPLKPESSSIEAGRILFRKIDQFRKTSLTFSFETTLSGTGHVGRIKKLKEDGFRIVIYYLKLSSPELAIARVRNRVLEGGHNIPEVDIRRRFERSWDNFTSLYRDLADDWIVFDNSEDLTRIIEESQ